MTSHRIETTGFTLDVIGERHPALDAIVTDYGSYRHGRYSFPKSIKSRVRAALAAPSEAPRTGWSNAARRRAGQRTNSHPLGAAAGQGDGYTLYEDGTFGGGRVQIWDES
jgi:hypothetical protein